MKSPHTFLISSGFLFLGGGQLTIAGLLNSSALLLALGSLLMLVMGVALLYLWWKSLPSAPPEDPNTTHISDNSNKEDTDENT